MPPLRAHRPGWSSKINRAGIIISLTPDSRAIIARRTAHSRADVWRYSTFGGWHRDGPQNSTRIPFVSVIDRCFNDVTFLKRGRSISGRVHLPSLYIWKQIIGKRHEQEQSRGNSNLFISSTDICLWQKYSSWGGWMCERTGTLIRKDKIQMNGELSVIRVILM